MDTFTTLKGNENPSSSSSSLNTTKKSPSSSCKYTGVRLRKWGKWVSEIRLPNSRERIWLGSYDTPEKAARAFDAAQFCLRGKSANFNFPNDPPDIPGGQSMSRSEIQAAAARFANLAAAAQGPEEPERVESMVSYSPTISEGTVQMDCEMTRAEVSFHEQLSLSAALGSGNYVSEFGYFTGFDDYITGEYHTISQPDNCGYNEEDTYDTSLYHDTCLWNF